MIVNLNTKLITTQENIKVFKVVDIDNNDKDHWLDLTGIKHKFNELDKFCDYLCFDQILSESAGNVSSGCVSFSSKEKGERLLKLLSGIIRLNYKNPTICIGVIPKGAEYFEINDEGFISNEIIIFENEDKYNEYCKLP